jgi:hypothetical protein
MMAWMTKVRKCAAQLPKAKVYCDYAHRVFKQPRHPKETKAFVGVCASEQWDSWIGLPAPTTQTIVRVCEAAFSDVRGRLL